MKIWKIKLHIIAEEFFQYSLVTYLFLLIAESLKEGLVSYFFNFNLLLFIVMLSGLIMALTDYKGINALKRRRKITSQDIEHVFLLTVVGGLLALVRTSELGTNAVIIAAVTAVLIASLSILLLTEDIKSLD